MVKVLGSLRSAAWPMRPSFGVLCEVWKVLFQVYLHSTYLFCFIFMSFLPLRTEVDRAIATISPLNLCFTRRPQSVGPLRGMQRWRCWARASTRQTWRGFAVCLDFLGPQMNSLATSPSFRNSALQDLSAQSLGLCCTSPLHSERF